VSTLAILTAAGSGARLGLGVPKALVELRGAPLVTHAVRRAAASGVVDAIVVTAPADRLEGFASAVADAGVDVPTRVVPGGPTRQASVAAGLACADADVEVVLVHDAARALAPPSLFVRVFEAVHGGHAAVVPGLPVVDTIKSVAAPSALGISPPEAPTVLRVTGTVDRGTLRTVQTPQGFERTLLDRAHAEAAHAAGVESTSASDDAGLVEVLGEDVWIVPGDAVALKITTVHDLAVAGLLLEESV
jgi:2-C-methyl-D-erythritol 4-phosphate cytidylyltransferase